MRLRAAALVWIALTAITGIVGQWLGYPLEHLWRWLLGLLIVALLIEYLTAQSTRLMASLIPSGTAYLGRESQWQLEVLNQSRWDLRVRFAPMSPPRFSGALPESTLVLRPFQRHKLNFFQIPQQLGEHPWPSQPVELGGIFHLASWLQHLPLHAKAEPKTKTSRDMPVVRDRPNTTIVLASTLVEPDQLQPAARRAGLDRQGPRTVSNIAMGGQEFHSLRTYAPGDSPANIDWKSTARSGQLRVRETQAEQQLLIYFALDCGRGSGLQIGDMTSVSHAANLIARMAEFANQAGDSFGILTFVDQPLARLRPSRGTAHLRALRTLLTQVETVDAESNPLSAVMVISKMLPQRALVLLFTSLDDVEAAGQLAQATLLLRPQHLPMLVSVEDSWVRETASGHRADAQDIYTVIAAREHRRSALRTRAQVERLGAIVIEAAPEKIEPLVFDRLRRLRSNHSV